MVAEPYGPPAHAQAEKERFGDTGGEFVAAAVPSRRPIRAIGLFRPLFSLLRAEREIDTQPARIEVLKLTFAASL